MDIILCVLLFKEFQMTAFFANQNFCKFRTFTVITDTFPDSKGFTFANLLPLQNWQN